MNRTTLLLLLATAGAALALVLLTSRRSSDGPHAVTESAASASVERAELVTSSAGRAGDERRAEPAARPASEREAVSPLTRATSAAPRGIHGRVVLPRGTPFGERVRIVFPKFRGKHVRVAEDGSFRTDVTPQACRIDIAAPHLYLPRPVFVREEAASAPIVLEPLLGGRIVGHVRRADGQEIDGELRLEPLAAVTRKRRVPQRQLDLPPSGAFHFDGLPEGRYRLTYSGDAYQPGPDECRVVGGRASVHDVQLFAGASVAGRIVGPDGELVKEATLTLPETARAVTAQDGEFVIEGVPPGALVLVVRSPGLLGTRFELGAVADGEIRRDLELRLTAGDVVEGRAVWPDGVPALAWIAWHTVGSAGGVATEPDGTFRITGLGPEPITLIAESSPSAETTVDFGEGPSAALRTSRRSGSATVEHVVPGTHGVLLVLQPRTRLDARLLDELGKPVRSARVRSRRVFRVAGALARADHAIRFVESRDGRFVLEELIPGEWELDVLSDGFTPLKDVRVRLPASEPIDLVLRPR